MIVIYMAKKKKISKTTKRGLVERIKGFIVSPSKSFKAETKTELTDAFKYALIGLAFMGVLLGLLFAIFPMTATAFVGPLAFIIMLMAVIIGGFIGLLIGGLWLHLWAYLLGARKGLKQTMKVVIFAKTPEYYLGWIPILNWVVGIWALVLEVIGLKQLQNLSTGRAVIAVLIATIIPLVIVIGMMLLMFSSLSPLFETAPTGMFMFPVS